MRSKCCDSVEQKSSNKRMVVGLGGCENLVHERKKFIFYTFINSEPAL